MIIGLILKYIFIMIVFYGSAIAFVSSDVNYRINLAKSFIINIAIIFLNSFDLFDSLLIIRKIFE